MKRGKAATVHGAGGGAGGRKGAKTASSAVGDGKDSRGGSRSRRHRSGGGGGGGDVGSRRCSPPPYVSPPPSYTAAVSSQTTLRQSTRSMRTDDTAAAEQGAVAREVDLVQPIEDGFERFSCSPMPSSNDLSHPHGEGKRTPAPQTNGFIPPKLPPPGPSAPPFGDQRCPVSTVRSAPSYDSQRRRPAARLGSPRKLVDIEMGIGSKAPVAKPAAAMSSSSVGVVVVASEAAPVARGLVLPCPPSDAEKVVFLQTFRTCMVYFFFNAGFGVLAGMLLCTIASPFLYWLGVPTVVVLVYFICYLAVTSRGKAFSQDKHDEVVQLGVEQDYLPTVDVFLPVCNESIDLIANTWKYVSVIDYPNVTVHVLDDGAKDSVRDLAQVFGFRYMRRDNRPEMNKAGNLRHAFARTTGEAVVIFDADFCPRSDFLRETLPYLIDPSVGIVQTPQFFRWSKGQTWVEKGAGTSQEFFYRMEQPSRNHFGASLCVGTCAVYRRAAVEPFGGVVAIEHSEDIHTGYKLTEAGFKVEYLPLCLATGVCPHEPRSFFMQQYRWCTGTLYLVFSREFWMADISAVQKTIFVIGMLYYVFSALFLFLTPLPVLILIWVKPSGLVWYQIAVVAPALFFAAIVLPCWSRSFGRNSFPKRMWRSLSWYRVSVIQCYAYVFAIKDSLFGTSAPWVPSGAGASQRSSSRSYDSSVLLLVAWNAVTVSLVLGGAIWGMKEYRYYDFVPAIALVLSSSAFSLSTLV